MNTGIDTSPLAGLKKFGSNVYALVFGILLAVFFISAAVDTSLMLAWAWAITLAVGLLMFLYLYKRHMSLKKTNQRLIQEFSRLNGFTYRAENKSIFEAGSLYKHGHSQAEANIISGSFLNLPMQLSNYEYTTGSGKSQQNFRLRVLRLTLPIRQPHMVIDCLIEEGDNATSSLPIDFDSSQRIQLEGEFYKYFNLYAIDQYAIDALSVIAPDAMDAMMRMSALCDIEIIDNYIYFYWPEDAYAEKAYKDIFETAQLVMSEIQNKLTSKTPVKSDAIVASSVSSSTSGLYLKRRGKLAPILIGAAFVALYIMPNILPESFAPITFLGFVVFFGGLLMFVARKAQRAKALRQAYFSSSNVHRR